MTREKLNEGQYFSVHLGMLTQSPRMWTSTSAFFLHHCVQPYIYAIYHMYVGYEQQVDLATGHSQVHASVQGRLGIIS